MHPCSLGIVKTSATVLSETITMVMVCIKYGDMAVTPNR